MHRLLRALLALLLVVAVLRVLTIPFLTVNTNPGPDGYDYLRVAREFLAGPFPWRTALAETLWAPGWPATLAVLFRTFGDSMFVVRAFNALSFLLALLLAHRLVRPLCGPDIALFAVTLMAWDNLVSFVKYANYEVFLTLLTTAALLAALAATRARRAAWLATCGLITGVACLVQGKSIAALAPAALFGALFDATAEGATVRREAGYATRLRASLRERAAALAAFGLTFGLVVLPYCVHNYRLEGRFTFVAGVGPMNLLVGNGPHANGEWVWTPRAYSAAIDALPVAARMDEARRLVVAHVSTHLGAFLLEMLPRKLWFFWGLDTIRHKVFLILMTIGLVVALRRAPARTFLLWMPIAVFMAIHLVYYGFERYRYPILPGIHAHVGLGIAWLAALFSGRYALQATGALASRGPDRRLTAAVLAALVGVTLVIVAAQRAMAVGVVHGLLETESGQLFANIWTTTDLPYPMAASAPGVAETPLSPTLRRVHCCFHATVPPALAAAPGPLTIVVRSLSGREEVFRWTQPTPR